MTQTDAGPGEAWSRRYQGRRTKDGQSRPNAASQPSAASRPSAASQPSAASRGSPEGRFTSEPGKALGRRLAGLKDHRASADVRVTETQRTRDRAEATLEARQARHRGGHLSWLLRPLIPVAIVAEGVTAYVAMEVLVPSRTLATGLAALAALVGAGLAGVLANRRLNQLPVPATARALEGIFVLVLTLLRYDSLHIQGADPVAAAGGAALAALISALGLLGIEEFVVETQTFAIFAGKIRAAWTRRRHDQAVTQQNMIRAQIQATGEKLEQHFVNFLLTEGMPLNEAGQRAAALRGALTSSGAIQ